jgi:hypothetical protein
MALATPALGAGFQLESPSEIYYGGARVADFQRAVHEQSDAVATIDASCVGTVGMNGEVLDPKGNPTRLRLSRAAFSDLCNFLNVPVAFIQRLGVQDERVAMDVLESCVRHGFDGSNRHLVIDTRSNRVDGIVSANCYEPLSNRNALSYVLAAGRDLEVAEGWLAGPRMRVNAVAPQTHEARKGDIVRVGVRADNSIAGDGAFLSAIYALRLVCTNGMTSVDAEQSIRIVHRAGIEDEVQRSVSRAFEATEPLPALMRAAAGRMLTTAADISNMRKFIAEQGGAKLEEAVLHVAMNEAELEGREPDEVSVWNFVNGLTAHAKTAPNLTRRAQIEDLGYRTLRRFAAPSVN